jgi:hypothetical protein
VAFDAPGMGSGSVFAGNAFRTVPTYDIIMAAQPRWRRLF